MGLYGSPWASGYTLGALGHLTLGVTEGPTIALALLEALDKACADVRQSGGNACVGTEVTIDPFTSGYGWLVTIAGTKVVLHKF